MNATKAWLAAMFGILLIYSGLLLLAVIIVAIVSANACPR